jgi:hypothetical protein
MTSLPVNHDQRATAGVIVDTGDFYERGRRHHESLALPYKTFWGEHLHHGLFLSGDKSTKKPQLFLVESCPPLLPSVEKCRVLDVGWEFRATDTLLAEQYRCHVTATTISPSQARYASGRAVERGVRSSTEMRSNSHIHKAPLIWGW